MTQQPGTTPRSAWPPVVLGALAMAWFFGVPSLMLQSLAEQPLFGGTVTTAQRASAQNWSIAALAWAIVVPLLGAILAYVTERPGWQMFFVGALVLGVLVGAACSYNGPPSTSHAPARDPLPTHCVERSGGGNECPGD